MRNLQRIAAAAWAVIAAAGCAPMQEMEPSVLADAVRKELAADPADSDAAMILSQALQDAAKAPPEGRPAVLQEARQRAAEARNFKIVEESPCRATGPSRPCRA